jgi:hypothetical protein
MHESTRPAHERMPATSAPAAFAVGFDAHPGGALQLASESGGATLTCDAVLTFLALLG